MEGVAAASAWNTAKTGNNDTIEPVTVEVRYLNCDATAYWSSNDIARQRNSQAEITY